MPVLAAVHATPPHSAVGLTLDELLREDLLLEAWQRVRANNGAAGVDGQSVRDFGTQVLGQLQVLQTELLSGQYAARPLQRVYLAKPGGGQRPLSIPAVRDRVAQTALAIALGKLLEPIMDDASHAYRPERSAMTAITAVCHWRDAGLQHVLEGDIESFFDQVPVTQLLRSLRDCVTDPRLWAVLKHWLEPVVNDGDVAHLSSRGLAQGSPLSPLLANWVLHPFDVAMRKAGHRLVRYADDFVILNETADAARHAHEDAQRCLQTLQLQLHPRKTKFSHFHHGFQFLGVRFEGAMVRPLSPGMAALLPQAVLSRAVGDAKHPPTGDSGAAESAHCVADDPEAMDDASLASLTESLVSTTPAGAKAAPLLHTVFVGTRGSALRLDGERLLVNRPDQPNLTIPLGQVDQIAIMQNVMVSSALMRHCSRRGIHLYMVDPSGQDAHASLERGALPDLELLMAQHALSSHPQRCLKLAIDLLDGKLHNSKVVLRRFARRSAPDAQEAVQAAIDAIDSAHRQLPFCAELASLRGHEGHAARAYFGGLAALLPPEWPFDARRRRPPPDPVNTLLSFGYAVLHSNMHSLVRLAGLNAHLGALHSTRAGGQALVNDLVEAFRAPVVDAVVLTLLREGRMHARHFETDTPTNVDALPCRLTQEGRSVYVNALEAKFQATFVHPRLGQALDMRRAMQFQVAHWARVVRGQDPEYMALKFR